MPKLCVSRRAALAAFLVAPLVGLGCSGTTGGGESESKGEASLASVTFSAGALNPASFAPETLSYFVSVPFGTAAFSVTPTAADAGATITVTQDAGAPAVVASGAASPDLAAPALGSRSIVTVAVNAPGKAARTYGFLVTQFVSKVATLSGLQLDQGTLTPDFAPAATAYAVSVPAGTATITVTPTASDPTSTLTIAQDSGAAVGIASGTASAPFPVPVAGTTSKVKVTVTAQDQATTKTYTVTVSQLATNDASLSLLSDSAGGLNGFAPATLVYTYNVPFQTAFTVTPTPTSPQATVKVNGVAVASGAASQAIPLSVGVATPITLVVTAQDGSTSQTYTLNVTEGPQAGLVTARTVPTAASPLLTVAANALLPANDASGVPVDTLLRIGFDAAPTLGTTGTVKIYQVGNATPVDTINVADLYAIYDGTSTPTSIKKLTTNQTSSKVNAIGGLNKTGIDQLRILNYVPILISGNTAVIVPHNSKLAYGGQYYVTIDNGLLVGTRNRATFTGMPAPATPGTSDPSAWQFTVKATAPTTLSVAADDSADFATVQGAIDAVAVNGTATINISPGVYQELLFIRKKNVTLKGTDSVATVIQYDNCDGFNPGTGGGQSVTNGAFPAGNLTGGGRAVLLTSSGNVVLDTITLKNLHGQGSMVLPTLPTPTTITGTVSPTFVSYSSSVTQAETVYFNVSFGSATSPALPAEPGQLIAKHSNFVSYQDTVQVKGWSWFYDCFITGDVDFIWGNANAALFERSEIKSRFKSANDAAVVQSRAVLGYDTVNAWPSTAIYKTYPGFVFLNSAFTKEPGDFQAYLARSPGAFTGTLSTLGSYYLYQQYDNVSYVNCSMDTHLTQDSAGLPSVGWKVTGGDPVGADVVTSPVIGWREYRSFTPDGHWVDVRNRLTNPSPGNASLGGSIQLSDASVAKFFADRPTIFGGATDGTYTTTGYPGGWNPQP